MVGGIKDELGTKPIMFSIVYHNMAQYQLTHLHGHSLYRMDEVMMRVDNMADSKSTDIGDYFGRIPEAVFVFLPEKYPDNIFSKDNRNTLSPTMV